MNFTSLKRNIKKWMLRLTATFLLIAGLLLVIVLNPILTYANKTLHNNYKIFHNKPLDPSLLTRLDEVTGLLKKSEIYNPSLKLDICLNDGSVYPSLIKKLRGQAFAWGFYNKVVLQGKADYKNGYAELNGYKWNLIQLLTHEAMHCLQYDKLGFWRSNPIGKNATWKWEGYPEYIARQNSDQEDLFQNISHLIEVEKKDMNGWGIYFSDSTVAPREYYNYWLLVQYSIDIKKMTYLQVLKDRTPEKIVKEQMMNWYNEQKLKRSF